MTDGEPLDRISLSEFQQPYLCNIALLCWHHQYLNEIQQIIIEGKLGFLNEKGS